jgi:hypothetical protein
MVLLDWWSASTPAPWQLYASSYKRNAFFQETAVCEEECREIAKSQVENDDRRQHPGIGEHRDKDSGVRRRFGVGVRVLTISKLATEV